jgi:acyl-CoA synthetase (AMP-forming)/AMP-acid ligase II
MPGARRLRDLSIAPGNAIVPVDGETLALLTFTSGSTGTPKGIRRTHAILRAQLEALSDAITSKPDERELVALPIVVLLNLANGVETVLPDADLRRPAVINAHRVLDQVSALGVTRLVGSPAFLERLADYPTASASLASVTSVVTGGGPVFPDLVQRLARAAPSAEIISVYGSTEAEPIAHVAHHEVGEAELQAMKDGAGLLTGRPVRHVQLRLIRASSAPIVVGSIAEFESWWMAAGDAGEIIVTGRHVVTHNLLGIGDAETKIRVGDIVWHRTGDLGRLDESGRLWLLGRANAASSDLRGTFYPFAVECAARLTLGVRRVAAFAREGRRVLVIEGDATPVREASMVRTQLAWAALDDVITVKRIPMDKRHNSKVDYPSLWRLLS